MRATISRFLASYFARLFSRLFTVVHTPFQRDFSVSSRCECMYLARSPHLSTCAINMHDNNLREVSYCARISSPLRCRPREQMVFHRTIARSWFSHKRRFPPPALRATAALHPTHRNAGVGTAHLAAEGHARRAMGRILVPGGREVLRALHERARRRAVVPRSRRHADERASRAGTAQRARPSHATARVSHVTIRCEPHAVAVGAEWTAADPRGHAAPARKRKAA